MPGTDKPLLIKRYASRRLYNTETSDYVTLEDIATFIREAFFRLLQNMKAEAKACLAWTF